MRFHTSVSEQGAELVRLVDKSFHLQHIKLAENTFVCDCSYVVERNNTIIFVVGASSAYKHWGNEKYFELGSLVRAKGYNPLFLLGPAEKKYAEQIKNAGFEYLTDVNFKQIAAMMISRKVKAVAGNDTGIMHMACAFDTPSVTVSVGGSHFTWFPYDQKKHKLCYPECAHVKCMNKCTEVLTCQSKISVQSVYENLMSLLS